MPRNRKRFGSRKFGSSKSHFIEPQGGAGRSWRKFVPVKAAGRVTDQMPGINFNARACATLKGNPCASKLVFVKKGDAAKLGTKPGPNLLYCLGELKPGPMVPVASAREATEMGKKYCACTKSGAAAKSCAVESAGFSGMRRGRGKGLGNYEAGGKTFPMFMQAVRYASERRLEVFEVNEDGSRGLRRWAPGTVRKPGKRHILVNKDGTRTEFRKVRQR